jgi:uncharacterized protein YidB (DUF937 family)
LQIGSIHDTPDSGRFFLRSLIRSDLRRYQAQGKYAKLHLPFFAHGHHRTPKEKTMGLLDGLIGGMVGAEMISVVNGLIEKHGGVQGVVNQLQTNGLGPTVHSWISDGPNAPVSAGDMHQAFGEQTLNEYAAKAGIPPQVLAEKLAQILPHAVDALTPEGTVPKA